MRTELFQGQFIPYTPAAATHPLDNENIVPVDMRANAAARYGKRDHQIVKAPLRDRTKRFNQLSRRRMPVVYRLRQQRPTRFPQAIEMFERAVAGLPFTVEMADEAAVDFHFHRQACQLIWGDRINKVRKRVFQYNRLFLPVFL